MAVLVACAVSVRVGAVLRRGGPGEQWALEVPMAVWGCVHTCGCGGSVAAWQECVPLFLDAGTTERGILLLAGLLCVPWGQGPSAAQGCEPSPPARPLPVLLSLGPQILCLRAWLLPLAPSRGRGGT